MSQQIPQLRECASSQDPAFSANICKSFPHPSSLLFCSGELRAASARWIQILPSSLRSCMEKPSKIAPAKGKLGVLLPGMGAVATTFMAGVELVRKGKSQPVGSLTQLGTIRLGKRTDGNTPLIKDFVPLITPINPPRMPAC